MNWFHIVKVDSVGYRGLDRDNECCRMIRERIRNDDEAVRLGIPNMIETMECEELNVFLDKLSIGRSVEIPDGRVITFRDDASALEHITDINDIFRECLEGKITVEYVVGQGFDDAGWRNRYS